MVSRSYHLYDATVPSALMIWFENLQQPKIQYLDENQLTIVSFYKWN